MKMSKHTDERWNKEGNKWLLGKKIVKVEYMTEQEMDEYGWSERPVCFLLDDGTWVIPFRDDEGNGGGSLSLHRREEREIIEGMLPVLY